MHPDEITYPQPPWDAKDWQQVRRNISALSDAALEQHSAALENTLFERLKGVYQLMVLEKAWRRQGPDGPFR